MKHYIITTVLLFAFILQSFGQEYKQWMQASDVKVTDIIVAAEAYLAEHSSRKDRKHFERWKYNAIRLQDENGYLPKTADVTRELEKFIEEKNTNALQRTNTANWQEVGPMSWNATAGYTPGVGRITSFATHPTDPNIYIIGAATGGVWKTTNDGASWTALSDNYTDMSVDALAIDPSNPNIYYWGSTEGRVYKSTDAGSTWNAVGTTDDFGEVNKIIIDPVDSDWILASSNDSGIFLSDDGGLTFYLEISNSNEPTGYDIEFKPGDTNIVYAAGHKFHKSTNAGDTYTTNTTDFDFNNQPKMIAVSPDNPNRVYVVEANGDGFNAIYVSNDSGDNFTKLSHSLNYFGYEQNGSDIGDGQAPRDMGIAVNPNDVDEVHIAGINTWRSLNGGTTFIPTSNWAYDGTNSYCHADVDDVVFKGNTLVALTDGGIYFATTSTALPSPTFYTDKSAGMGIHQFYKIGISQTATTVITGGAQDNGNSTYDGTNWTNWLGADGMESFVDRNNTNILYGEQQNGSLFTSTDGGMTNDWLAHPPGQDANGDDIKGGWVTPFEQDPIDASTLYAAYKNVYKSTDSGNSWTSISQTFTDNLENLKIAPSDNNVLFASLGGSLYKTTTGGGTWALLSGYGGNHINSIAIHPTNANKIAIAVAGTDKVYLSDDGGSTWSVSNTGLPSAFAALCVTWQNSENNCLYVGMNYGIYYTSDISSGWTNYSTGIPNVQVNELEINNVEGKIYAGTYGRGVWKSDVHEPSILPIELGDFQAILRDKVVDLYWFTHSEMNNDYFIVQKSADGISWEDFTKVEAKGNSTTRSNYQAKDETPFLGLNYYRLVDVDINGQKQYSKVVSVNLTGVDLLNIYPNPSTGLFLIYLDAAQNSEVNIEVYNAMGVVVNTMTELANTGINEVPLNLDLAPGIYFLTIRVDGTNVYQKKRLVIEK